MSVISGNCNLDGTFLLRSNEALLIKHGKIEGRIKRITVKDSVFSVLNNICAVGNDAKLCLGSSSCGKGGDIKVDAGGPHLLAITNVEINNEYI